MSTPLRCPNCENTDTVIAYVPVAVTMNCNTGYICDVDLTSLEPNPADEAFCPECEYGGTLEDFYDIHDSPETKEAP